LGLFGYALRSIGYFSAVPGVFWDDRFNSVILEHLFRWVAGREAALWSPPFFYPFEHVLAFSDNHFGSAIFYILLRLLGLSREVAFDGWFLIGIILTFFCACWALRRIGLSQLASAVGAFVFSFSLPVLHVETHAQFIYRFAIPLAFAAFWSSITTRRLLLLWQVVFWVTIQFFCSIYLGVFLFYLLSATFIAWLIVEKNERIFSHFLPGFQKEKRSARVFFCVATFINVSMLAWLLYEYYAAMLAYHLKPPLILVATFSPRLSYYFSHGSLIFFGFGVWSLCLFGVAMTLQKRFKNNVGMIAIVSFCILFLGTLSIKGQSLYLLFAHLPGISALRGVARIVLVMLLPIGILAAVGVHAVQSKMINVSTLKKMLLLIVLFGLLGTEVALYKPQNTSIREWHARQNALLEKLPTQLPSHPIIFVTTKEGEPLYMAELDGMILAQDLGVPTLNGYSGNVPPGYSPPIPCSSYLNRLRSYAIYRHMPLSAIGSLAQRVVTISPTPCAHVPAVGFWGNVDPAQVKDIVLRIANVKKENNSLVAKIIIHNASPSVFYTFSLSEKPIRLSWRFIPLSHTGEPFSEPGWEPRKDLYRMISPNESIIERIDSILPKIPGSYLFEVSLVQDGVAWFHEWGMKIARMRIEVDTHQE
jgi:hypothetical protein